MKKLLIIAALVSTSFTINAQKRITKDSLIRVMGIEMCEELGNLKDTEKSDDIQAKLGLIMMPSILKHMEDIQAIYKIETLDEKSMYEVGKDLGMHLATSCDKFLALMANNIDQLKPSEKSTTKKQNVLNGTFLKLSVADVSFIEIKTATGKTEKLYWMSYFDGADDLATGTTKFMNKKVVAKFEEKEIYKPTLKDYIKIKVLVSLELQ